MENASKALMMAAGVLIGLLILSLAVFLFTNFGAASAEAHRKNEENQINQFNAQFTVYEGRTDVTIHDIVTVANLARDNNEKYGLETQTKNQNDYYIEVTVIGNSKINEKTTPSDLEKQLSEEIQKGMEEQTFEDGEGGEIKMQTLPTYNCSVHINEITKRVDSITFTKK